jgi:GTP-binding protein Era
MPQKKFKSGFISIIGRPNVGKSTLLNSILSKKVAIVSEKPQTTRNRITGIKNINGNQLIFLDTPGIHEPKSSLNKFMVDTAIQTFNTVDLILALVSSDEKSKNHNEMIFRTLSKVKTPTFLIINKIDLIRKDKLLPLIDHYRTTGLKLKKERELWREIIPISALHQEYIDSLVNRIIDVLPEGPHYFPDGVDVDHSEKFLVSEFIREKAIGMTKQEVPYSLAVLVENIREGKKGVVVIDAIIYVERDSQKGIIIGKKGARLKEIGKKARVDIENWFGSKVFLSLYVKVKKEWSNNKRDLKELGYSLS